MQYGQNNGVNNNYPNNNYVNTNQRPITTTNEYYVNNTMPLSYHIKRFLVGLLLVALLIFLLLWLFPTKAGLKATIKDGVSDAFNETFVEKLNPLYDRIFGDNINTMKEVATAYFTTDRLPKTEGETKKLTLGEMLDMKLLLEIKDKNGKTCDRDKSYVEVTKMDKEYKMKVNLSCSDQEDYIIVYLGCYNYCLNDVCEKKAVEQAKTTSTNNVANNVVTRVKTVTKTKVIEKHVCGQYKGKYYGKDGSVVSYETYKKQCTSTPKPEKHYCAIVDGKYYGKNGTIVSKKTYKNECESKPEKHYCAIVDGKHYGKYGKVVSYETYKKQCEPEPEKHYCVIFDGKYYGKNGDVVNKDTYIEECTTQPEPEKHYCEVIDGKYYGKNGNVVNKDTYKSECEPEQDVYKYLYEKIVETRHETQYSAWTDWSANIEYNPNNNNINWGQHELEWNEKVGYKLTKYYEYVPDKNQPIYNVTYDKLLGYRTLYTCDGYTYYIDSTTNTVYQTTGSATSGWSKVDRVTLQSLPTNTNTKRYVYVGMNYDYCAETCNLKPYYIFDVYTRNAGSPTTTSASTSKSTVSAVCSKVSSRQVPIYGKNTTFAGYVTNKVAKEKKTYYYHRKTRTITQKAYIDRHIYRAWAYSSTEATLINQGYKYTGHYEKIS